MPRGQLYINNIDVFDEYGISMDQNALSTLMTPASKKEWITNDVRDEDGTRYLLGSYAPRNAARDLSLTFNLVAPDINTFFTRYAAFCSNILDSGIVNIRTAYQPNVVYRCVYVSCNQFTQFRREMAQFQLKLIENNPSNRSL